MLKNQDYQDAMSRFNEDLEQVSDDVSDDDLRGFLGDIGIRFSDVDEDPEGPTS